jgi:hypothetical protein
MDIKAGTTELTATYLGGKSATWGWSLAGNFLAGRTYGYSLWVYEYQGDPEVYVCIWGPGEDGLTFQVELSAAWLRTYTLIVGALVTDFQNWIIIEANPPGYTVDSRST